jgi:hypothetical protein
MKAVMRSFDSDQCRSDVIAAQQVFAFAAELFSKKVTKNYLNNPRQSSIIKW